MPKSTTIGNGNMLITLDQFSQVDGLYFPFVGLEDHVGKGYLHKMGVWANNRFAWLEDSSWQMEQSMMHLNLANEMSATNHELGIKLNFHDIVYNENNIFIREVQVSNLTNAEIDVRLFFNQQFEIYESDRGDTAYYDPERNVVVHYKGRRVFLVNAKCEQNTFQDYSIGLLGIEGKEGTYRDAEDGELQKNPIEHGLVDSVIGLRIRLAAGEQKTAHYWLAISKHIQEVHDLNQYVLNRTPDYLINSTNNYWKAWVTKQKFTFHGLSNETVRNFQRSLLIIRSHVDNNGAIIASGDAAILQHGRDNYSYMWPRDGAFTALALAKAGDKNVAQRFFEFCNDVITEEGYFMHKYRSDRSLGSSWHPWVKRDGTKQLPIQEDETALIIISLWEHYQHSKDLEFVERVYNSLIKKASQFMLDYFMEDLGLPQPSYDLWEEHYAIHCFTSSTVYAAFLASANFASLLGKVDAAAMLRSRAEELRKQIVANFYDEQLGYFIKSIYIENDGTIRKDDTLDMASIYAVYRFNILPVDDPKVKSSINKVETELCCSTDIGGVPRYAKDNYYRRSPDSPANPWIITTMWLARYYIRTATSEKDMEPVISWLEWVNRYTPPSGAMSEQISSINGEQLSATPLTWSHSEYVLTVVEYLEKLYELGVCDVCLPDDPNLGVVKRKHKHD